MNEIAGAIVIGQGILLLIAIRLLRTFGVYAEMLMETHKQNIQIRLNLATQENEMAIRQMNSHKEREA